MNFTITKSAAQRIAELISKDKSKTSLRVAVDGGGCSGFMYQYELIDTTKEDDLVIESHDIKVAIDTVSMEFLEGCTLDFVRELGSSYFQIKNPNASAKCGCGSSFAI